MQIDAGDANEGYAAKRREGAEDQKRRGADAKEVN